MQAQLAIVSVPVFTPAGMSFTAVFNLANTGTVTLPSTGPNLVRIGSQSPQDNNAWGTTRIPLPHDLAPGQSVQITVNLTAPPGAISSHVFGWQMVQEGVQWFGNTVQTTVYLPLLTPMPPNPNDGSIVGQQIVNTMVFATNLGPQSIAWDAPASGKFAILMSSIWHGLMPGFIADMGFQAVRKSDNCMITSFPLDRYSQPGTADIRDLYFPEPGIIIQPGDKLICTFFANSESTQAQQLFYIWGKYLSITPTLKGRGL